MASVNPKHVNWVNPTTYTDGSAYDQSDNAGYTLQLDGVGAVSIPLAWGTSFDLTSLGQYKDLKRGDHTVAVAVVSKAGVQSDFSVPATFSIEVPPMAPTSVVVD